MNSETVIKTHHDAGFFSICNINLLTVMNYYINNQNFCRLDTSDQWNLYKDNTGDAYSYYFKYDHSQPKITASNYYLNSDTEIQFSNYKLINYGFVNVFIKKYFTLSDQVLKIEQDLINKYNIVLDKIISICYRGGDKKKETNLPSYKEMSNKLQNIYANNLDYKIIIQSDEQEFCDYIQTIYPDNSIVFKEIKKISQNDSSAIQYHTQQGNKVSNAQTFLAIMSIMSKTKTIILNSGNVGMFICLFRGNANNVYQYYSPINSSNIFWY